MTPGAQIAAAIELLETVQEKWEDGQSVPVDAMLGDYFRKRRYIGAKDKGFISRRVYLVLRQGASLQWFAEQGNMPASPRSLALTALVREEKHPLNTIRMWFSGEDYSPRKLYAEELAYIEKLAEMDDSTMPEWMRLNVPQWCIDRFKTLFGDDTDAELNALNTEAPLDLRVNTLKSTREEVRQSLWSDGFDAKPTPYSPWGLRLDKRGALFNTKAFKNGWVEVQDEGSQLVALLANPKPGEKVIDFCAGAGGKTLALAAMMQNKGRILAWDTSETRLEQSAKRLRRAGVDNVQRHALTSETDSFIKRHKDSADVVVIDAPCSGSGTWRRNPDLKWRFGERDLAEITAIQERILDSARRLVKKGGKLLYITCSLFEEENESQVKQFLTKYPEFTLASPSEIWDNDACKELSGTSQYLRLSPHRAGTDGFFAAILHKN